MSKLAVAKKFVAKTVLVAKPVVESEISYLGAGWVKQGPNAEYINFSIKEDIPAGSFVQVFVNTKKTKESQPDYNIVCYAQEA
jgi:hypothetical protein